LATAADIMTKAPMTLVSSTTIVDAVKLFVDKKFSSVPVITSTKETAGQLTELVLVRILVLHQLQPEKYKQLANCLDLLETPTFVAPTDNVATIMKAIMKSTSRRVLVQNNAGKIEGIISPKDLLRNLMAGNDTAKTIQAEVQKI
jgi:CBS-domain-containing membrane protein